MWCYHWGAFRNTFEWHRGTKRIKEKKKGGKGWKCKRSYFPLNRRAFSSISNAGNLRTGILNCGLRYTFRSLMFPNTRSRPEERVFLERSMERVKTFLSVAVIWLWWLFQNSSWIHFSLAVSVGNFWFFFYLWNDSFSIALEIQRRWDDSAWRIGKDVEVSCRGLF